MSSSGRIYGFLRRVGHGVKDALKPGDQATTSHTPAPSPSQATPTGSLLAADNNQPVNAVSSLAPAGKKTGADAWSGLKAALRLLERSSDAFPPLKSAVGGLLGGAAQNQKNYAEIASNLQDMVDEFQEHPGEQTSSNIELRKHVKQQQGRSRFWRRVGAGQDVVDVQDCYRRVENLRRALEHKGLVKILNNQNTTLDKILGNQGDQDVDARLKELNAALKAMYDSSLADVVGRRTCTPGTRKAILTEMRSWADNPAGPKVYWLNGMAGTGKTTLAYSFCTEMQHARRLGASFFCSRADADSRDVSRIVPTIAHQLARLLPSYREVLVRCMGEDKEIGARRIEAQFEKLIRGPLREIGASVPEGIVIMIDALDECDRRDGAQDILDVLFLHAGDLPVKFFVTCRPEPGLFDTLRSKDESCRSVLHLHDIEASFVQADITTFLEAELASIALPEEKIQQLAEQAGTLFIYAATAVRYIHPKGRPVNFHRRLDDVLSVGSKTDTNKHAAINDLYTAVLNAPFTDKDLNPGEKNNIRLVLDTAVCAKEPMSVLTMTRLLGLNAEQDIIYAVQHLRSVLHLSEGSGLISTFHASFPDFMLSRERSGDLCCDVAEHNQHLALGCLSTMQRLLRFNICELESSFVLDQDIIDSAKRIEQAILPELFYACRYWGDHLKLAKAPDNVHSAVEDFLSNRLLFWMEVLNLRNCIGAGAQILIQIYVWLQKSGGANDVLELALDASRFVTAFSLSPASRSTPHIYMSALPFWPDKYPVRLRYWKRTQGLIKLKGSGMEGRDLSCLATWNAGSRISCMAQSPDGTRIVSGSWDNTICVWDAYSRLLVAGPFRGHTGSVLSVALSPGGTRIVSGSCDKTIRVWDTLSGLLIAGPFVGHTNWVHSVTFSSDGSTIVSSSGDETIRVWDAHSGDLVAGPFKGHTSSILSVALSPDGTCIVSGSDDKTIRVWDAHSGDLVAGPFKGHTSSVNSVAVSPDGTRIVSGSDDATIRVWNARSGDLVAGPFQGHTGPVLSVALSPDGTRIVSGSLDKTIRVWDAYRGDLVAGPFKGHTSSVYSVAFSPDGTHMVSSSHDNTIRVWDAHSGLLAVGLFEGHTNSVRSVAFSPDNTRIVSGSDDTTIRVWDAYSGNFVIGPFKEHTDSASSVVFSPDGTRIASSSSSSTVRVWNARDGDLVVGPFEGPTSSIQSVAFSPNGTLIAAGSYGHTISVWHAHSGSLLRAVEGRAGSINSVAFSPDSTRIASGSSKNVVQVWGVPCLDLVAGPFEGHIDSVTSVVFSPDGTCIVSGSADRTICVWNAHSGDLVAGPFEGHTSSVNSVAISPDGTRIVSGSDDATIRVWNARSGDLVAGPFQGHTGPVLSVALSPDGARIISGSVDNTIRVWAATPLHIHDPDHLKNWLMDETGIITTRQGQLLLCVPVDLQAGVIWPQNTICIRAKGVLKPDFDGALLGNNWVKCYQSQ